MTTWNQRNREKRLIICRNYYQRKKLRLGFRDKTSKGKDHWHYKHGLSKTAEYHAEQNKKWINENREYKNYLNLQRWKLKKKAEGSHSFQDWLLLKAFYNWTCPCCGKKEPEIVLTEDHIVPLSKGGTDYIQNIQPLCKSCNSKKLTKIIFYGENLYLRRGAGQNN